MMKRGWAGVFWGAWVLCLAACRLYGDQVEMQNGDRYVGKVVSLGGDTLVIQSDVLGTLRLPRSKVALITLGSPTAAANPTRLPTPTNSVARPPLALATNALPDLSAMLRQLRANTNLIQQVQSQLLSGASSEANDKFNELVSGLLNGKLTLNDIRAEAKSAADQMRTVRKDLGEDAGFVIDGYLAILDSFLKETAPLGEAEAKSPKPAPQSKPGPAEEE